MNKVYYTVKESLLAAHTACQKLNRKNLTKFHFNYEKFLTRAVNDVLNIIICSFTQISI